MKNKKKLIVGLLSISMLASLTTGCGTKLDTSSNSGTKSAVTVSDSSSVSTSDIFTDRDLKQEFDLSDATTYEVKDNKDITIQKEGIYVISGTAKNVSIIVDTDDNSKVQLVLKDLTITNESKPCIYVKNADKTFVTTTGDNSLTVTDTFTNDGTTNTDAVIFSKDDLVVNGTGSLTIQSSNNGITSKDDLKITGGTISITSEADAIEASNSIAVADGDITIHTNKDGLHAEYDEDDSIGYVYIKGGKFNINAADDGIHATTSVQIDGGDITIEAHEGIEGTYVKINDGTISIDASDDGVNATNKSSSLTTTIEINGGNLTINMGQGDTDAIDSNGNLYINGGTINITGQSPFDYDGESNYTGGTIIVNGEETNEITNQMMGGGPGRRGRR